MFCIPECLTAWGARASWSVIVFRRRPSCATCRRYTPLVHGTHRSTSGDIHLEPQRLSSSSAGLPRRRRFCADNTRGRSDHIRERVKELKALTTSAERQAFFEKLHPRDKLDVLKALHSKRKRKRHHSGLPKYYSGSFQRSFYFREEDVEETSTLGRGPGGQATNRRKQTVILTHKPTDLMVKVSRFPSLRLNRRAARELLNLRLEYKLAGPRSILGMAQAAKARRAAQRARETERAQLRKAVRAYKASHSRHYYRFLKGDEPLPPYAMMELLNQGQTGVTGRGRGTTVAARGHDTPPSSSSPMTSANSGPAAPSPADVEWQREADLPGLHPLYVTSLLNEECRHLWALLSHACRHANPELPDLLHASSLSPDQVLALADAVEVEAKQFWEQQQQQREAATDDGDGGSQPKKENRHPSFPPEYPSTSYSGSYYSNYNTPALLRFVFPASITKHKTITKGRIDENTSGNVVPKMNTSTQNVEQAVKPADTTSGHDSATAIVHEGEGEGTTNARRGHTNGEEGPGYSAVVCCGDPHGRREVERCRGDAAVLQRVRAAFSCMCELFGLHLVEVTASPSEKTSTSAVSRVLVLKRDGVNWRMYSRRLWIPRRHPTPVTPTPSSGTPSEASSPSIKGENGDLSSSSQREPHTGGQTAPHGELTHIGVLVWGHILCSLAQLGLKAEREAVRKFLLRLGRGTKKKGGNKH